MQTKRLEAALAMPDLKVGGIKHHAPAGQSIGVIQEYTKLIEKYNYLVRVMEWRRDGFENDKEKTMLVENKFEQTDEGDERKL